MLYKKGNLNSLLMMQYGSLFFKKKKKYIYIYLTRYTAQNPRRGDRNKAMLPKICNIYRDRNFGRRVSSDRLRVQSIPKHSE